MPTTILGGLEAPPPYLPSRVSYYENALASAEQELAKHLPQARFWEIAWEEGIDSPLTDALRRQINPLLRLKASQARDNLSTLESRVDYRRAERDALQTQLQAYSTRQARHPDGLTLTKREFNEAGRQVEGFLAKWTRFSDKATVRFAFENVPIPVAHAPHSAFNGTSYVTPLVALELDLSATNPVFSTATIHNHNTASGFVKGLSAQGLFELITEADWLGLITEARRWLTNKESCYWNRTDVHHNLVYSRYDGDPNATFFDPHYRYRTAMRTGITDGVHLGQDPENPHLWHLTLDAEHYIFDTVERTYRATDHD
jgi:hypothetical protein